MWLELKALAFLLQRVKSVVLLDHGLRSLKVNTEKYHLALGKNITPGISNFLPG
jgi:hypothetical protein